jgi:alpha-glucosidase
VLTVHLYAGKQGSEFVYYEDDGETYAHEKGDYHKRTITFDAAAKAFRFAKAEGNRTSKFKQIRLVMHGFETLPKELTVQGKKIAWQADSAPMLKSGSGFDPLGTQSAGSAGKGVKALMFGNSGDAFSVSW